MVAALPPELLLCCNIVSTGLYDLVSGSSVLTFKHGQTSNEELTSTPARKTTTFVEAKNGVGGIVMGLSGPGKGALNIWSFAKESTIHRCMLPAKLTCIALSPTGNYLAGGTDDGRLFLWEIGSGDMIASFDAHYRAITCLAWTRDADGALISGSEDAAAHVWCLPDLLSGSSAASAVRPQPYLSLRDHTLPITDMAVGSGRFPRVRVLTASSDSSCKIWDLLHPTAALLSTLTFPPPFADISHVAFDELERYFFTVAQPLRGPAGSSSNSAEGSLIRRVDLYRKTPEEMLAVSGTNQQSRAVEGRTYSTSVSVTALLLSCHSPSLLLGLANGQVSVLALPSLQLLKTIVPSTLPAPPITFLGSLLRPPDLIARANLGGRAGIGKEEELPARPVAALARTMKDSETRLREHVVHLRLTDSEDPRHLIDPPVATHALSDAFAASTTAGSGKSSNQVAELQAENAKLRDQLARAISINDTMWNSVVSGALAPGIQLK